MWDTVIRYSASNHQRASDVIHLLVAYILVQNIMQLDGIYVFFKCVNYALLPFNVSVKE